MAGATAAISGLDSTSLFTLSRRLLRGRIVLLEVGSYVTSMSFILAAAWSLRTYDPAALATQTQQLEALVVGSLISAVFEVVVSYLLLPGPLPRFGWDADARRELVRFGGWIFLSTACTFLGSQADRLVIGKISLATLGVYHIAAMLAAVPTMLMAALGGQLLFPLYSRMLHAGHDLRSAVARPHLAAGVFGGILVTGLACVGPTLVECLYDRRYREAGPLLRLLCAVSWLAILQGTGELALLARGRTRRLALGQVARLLVLPVFLPTGYYLGGVEGLVVGFGAAELVRYGFTAAYVHGEGFPVLRYDLPLTAVVGGVCLLTAGVGSLCWDGFSSPVRLVLESFAVCLLWAASIGVSWAAWSRGWILLPQR
jgi:O-antigen/teichoic acid export membrane protein